MADPSFCPPPPTPALREQDRAEPCPRGPVQAPAPHPRPVPAYTQQAWPTPGPCPVSVQLVITALKCHKYDKNIQVTGSAALFYLTNSEYRSEQSVKLRRQVIQVVLNGMESYQEVTVSPCPLPALAPRPVSRPCQQARRSLGCHACSPPFSPGSVPLPSQLPFLGHHSQPLGPGIQDPLTWPHPSLSPTPPSPRGPGPLLLLVPSLFFPVMLCWVGVVFFFF